MSFQSVKRSIFAVFVPALVLALQGLGQTPATSPTPATGDYTVTSSIELGLRALSFSGDHEKYKSDLNYRAGFRIFDSSFLIENNSKGSRLFDNALFTSSGWGADPSGSFRVNVDKTGIYKFDGDVRRVRYFNNLKSHAVTWSQPVSTGSQHRANTAHNFGDFDLTVFPARAFRMRFGYSFNDTKGPGASNIRFSGDEYTVNSAFKNNSHDLRAGVEGELFGFNLGLTYGRRIFRDRTRFFVDSLNLGNNTLPTTSQIGTATRDFHVDGETDFVNTYLQRTFARRLDLTGRVIYSNSNSDMTETDLLRGRASATGNIIVSDSISVPGRAKRTQTRADLGLTYRANEKLRLSNTLTFDQFNVGGSLTFFELVRATTGGGVPIPDVTTRTYAWRGTSYRRFTDLAEVDYQVNQRLGFNMGFRVTGRTIAVAIYDVNLVTGAVQRAGEEDLDNSTVTLILGTKFKPHPNWRVYADVEKGESDNVFTRLANNDFTNFRVRSNTTISNFTFAMSLVFKNNDSPGTSRLITSSGGFPETETIAMSRTRIFSTSVDWSPSSDLTLAAGYTLSHQTSRADIIVPVGTPIFPSTRFLLGLSEYYLRDNYFFFDINARPHRRVALYASYRIDHDRGQGDRIQNRPQDMISSYPMRFQTPEARVAVRLSRNIDWNVGYQYYSYRDKVMTNPFATPTAIVPAQNYHAHMPYTSLRIYFGRAVDR